MFQSWEVLVHENPIFWCNAIAREDVTIRILRETWKEKKGGQRKRERNGGGRGELIWLGEEKQSLWSSRIYTKKTWKAGLGSIPSGCWFAPCRMPFLIEVFKMLSMEKTERSWEEERGNWLFLITFHLLNNARCPWGISNLTLSSCSQDLYFLLSPPHCRAQDFNYREGEGIASVWKASRAFFFFFCSF